MQDFIYSKLPLVQAPLLGNNPLPKPTLPKIKAIVWHHYATMNSNTVNFLTKNLTMDN